MVRRSDYSVENTPKRDEKGQIISQPKKISYMRSRAFILPLLCIGLVIICGLLIASFGG